MARRETADVGFDYGVEIHDPKQRPWREIGECVLEIEREQFGEGAFEEEYLRFEFEAAENVVVSLWEGRTGTLIGFTFAVPIEEVDPWRPAEPATAYICDTVIASAHQGHGLIAHMMLCLEGELRRRGFLFVERDVAVANGYAAKIERAYGPRIMTQSEPHQSEWGPQVFFRIRL